MYRRTFFHSLYLPDLGSSPYVHQKLQHLFLASCNQHLLISASLYNLYIQQTKATFIQLQLGDVV